MVPDITPIPTPASSPWDIRITEITVAALKPHIRTVSLTVAGSESTA
jgi:hypothetical protein